MQLTPSSFSEPDSIVHLLKKCRTLLAPRPSNVPQNISSLFPKIMETTSRSCFSAFPCSYGLYPALTNGCTCRYKTPADTASASHLSPAGPAYLDLQAHPLQLQNTRTSTRQQHASHLHPHHSCESRGSRTGKYLQPRQLLQGAPALSANQLFQLLQPIPKNIVRSSIPSPPQPFLG